MSIYDSSVSIYDSIAFVSIVAVVAIITMAGPRPSGACEHGVAAGRDGEREERALAELLVSLFDDAALRRWARYRLGRAVYDELPQSAVSIDELAFATVLAVRRHGVSAPALFRSLSAERPGRARDVWRVASLWAARAT